MKNEPMTSREIVYALCSWAFVNLQEYCRENGWPCDGATSCPELVGIICSRMGKPTAETLAKLEAVIRTRDEYGNVREMSTNWFTRQAEQVQREVQSWPRWKLREAGIEHLYPAPTHPCA